MILPGLTFVTYVFKTLDQRERSRQTAFVRKQLFECAPDQFHLRLLAFKLFHLFYPFRRLHFQDSKRLPFHIFL